MTKELQVRVLPHEAATQSLLTALVARELGIDARTVRHLRVLRRSIDARQRTIYVNLTLRVYINEEPSDDAFVRTEYGDVSKAPQAIVVGEGPGGLFAALRLIELGVRPVILERGKNVADRRRDVADISRSHKLFSVGNVIILHEYYLYKVACISVLGDNSAHLVDELDYCLCTAVARSRFSAEDESRRLEILYAAVLDAVIQPEYRESIEELALVLVEALYLYVEYGIRRNCNIVVSLYEVGKLLLLVLLNVDKAAEHVLVVCEL